MSQEQQQDTPEDEGSAAGNGQQQEQPQAEGHAGHGSESIIKQLREWETRRNSNSGGKRRPGPN
jgi:hypothetical protein